ncbi:MAG: hypothetical protein ACLQIB_49645, partial [Isosphaeraceae bacterium]
FNRSIQSHLLESRSKPKSGPEISTRQIEFFRKPLSGSYKTSGNTADVLGAAGAWLFQVCLVHVVKVTDPRGVGVIPNDAVFGGVEAQVGLGACFAESLNHLRCELSDAGFAEESVKYSHERRLRLVGPIGFDIP